MKTKKITYLDTYCEGGYTYEDYKEWCEECEVGADVEGGEDYWRWIEENKARDFDDFMAEIRTISGPVVVTGSLGLWWGRPEIAPTKFNSLNNAISQCIEGAEAIEVILENGVLTVKGAHHDGTNIFEIRPLTELGADRMDNDEKINVNSHWHCGKFGEYLY